MGDTATEAWWNYWASPEYGKGASDEATFLAGYRAGQTDGWDKGIENGDCGCAHDTACSFETAANPYRARAAAADPTERSRDE